MKDVVVHRDSFVLSFTTLYSLFEVDCDASSAYWWT